MKKYYLLIICLLLYMGCGGDDDPFVGGTFEGDIRLTTQEEVEAFAAKGHTEINGSLTISGGLFEVTDLSGLSTINRVTGALNIYGTRLTSLRGLENLEQVGLLELNNNDMLLNLSGLSGLTTIDSDLLIRSNLGLRSLTGLEGLTNVTSLGVYENDLLESLNGLQNLPTTMTHVFIEGNLGLTTLDGLPALTKVNGYLSVGGNHNLVDIDVLGSLTEVVLGLELNRNFALENADVFDQLTVMDGARLRIVFNGIKELNTFNQLKTCDELTLGFNDELVTISGFEQLEEVTGNLWINWNPKLTAMPGLKKVTEIDGFLRIEDNETLAHLDDLNALVSVTDDINIRRNSALTDLCGLQNVIRAANSGKLVEVIDNAFNPSAEDILAGNCRD